MQPSTRCLRRGCTKRPTYGVEASRKRECCAVHALPGMVNIDLTRCNEENCETRASYGEPGSGRRMYCSKHALPGMQNIERKMCARPGCMKPPAYWHVRNRKRRCCIEHAEEGMVKLDKKLCPVKDCYTSASYGVVGEKRKYCAAHATGDMISIGGRRCANTSCSKRANYGVFGTRKREYCAEHAEVGMVNINNQNAAPIKSRRGRGEGTTPARQGPDPAVTAITVESGVGSERSSVIAAACVGEQPAPDVKGVVRGSGMTDGADEYSSDVGSSDSGSSDSRFPERSLPSRNTHYYAAAAAAAGAGVRTAAERRRRAPVMNQSIARRRPASGCWSIAGNNGAGAGAISEVVRGHAASRTTKTSNVEGASMGGATARRSPPPSMNTAFIEPEVLPSPIKRERDGGEKLVLSGGSSLEREGDGVEEELESSLSSSSSYLSSSASWTSKRSSKPSKVLLPWPKSRDCPPLLLTSSGWSTWDWQPVMIN